jgi:hypothetical protein
MDLVEALNTWSNKGNTTKSYHDEEKNYCIDFINKNNEKVGWFKTIPGQGFRWEYPDELFADDFSQPLKNCNISRQFQEDEIDEMFADFDDQY